MDYPTRDYASIFYFFRKGKILIIVPSMQSHHFERFFPFLEIFSYPNVRLNTAYELAYYYQATL